MSRRLFRVISRVVIALFAFFVFILSDKLLTSGVLGALRVLSTAIELTLTSTVPGICAGVGCYSLHSRICQNIHSEFVKYLVWWVAVIGGGTVGVLVGTHIAYLYLQCDSSLEGPSATGLLVMHTIIPGALGIAFGAGWGQGEKLM